VAEEEGEKLKNLSAFWPLCLIINAKLTKLSSSFFSQSKIENTENGSSISSLFQNPPLSELSPQDRTHIRF